jgi:proteasome lid subunit RPN8/RPN11
LAQLEDPRLYNPTDWAALAKLAGVRYVMFTAKHHNGFAMFHTKTTLSAWFLEADLEGKQLQRNRTAWEFPWPAFRSTGPT